MVQSMTDHGTMIKQMVGVIIGIRMAIYIKDFGKMINLMNMEIILMFTDQYIVVRGNKICSMDTVQNNGVMEVVL